MGPSLSRPGSQQLPPSIRRDGDEHEAEHEAGEASHRGAVSRRDEKSPFGIGRRPENERLGTLKMARNEAYTLVAALLRRSKNRTAAKSTIMRSAPSCFS
jgi:hypothetical protein